jgi:feruloyl esterase
MEAERYPEDYDGILAGAPAYDWTGVATDFVWNTKALHEAGAAIPISKVPAIQGAVREACSVTRGFVHDPPSCKFDPAALLCKSADSDSCLTAPQVSALKKIYAGPRDSKGASIGKIKVITIDYREAPEYHFPVASEDVAAVYGALLKAYKPSHIGI